MKELKISEYSFHEFLSTFQQAVIDGFRLDLESNERFPQKYGSHMEVTMVVPEAVLPEVTPPTEPKAEVPEAVLPEVTPPTEPKAEVPVVASQEQAEVVSEAVTSTKTRKGK